MKHILYEGMQAGVFGFFMVLEVYAQDGSWLP